MRRGRDARRRRRAGHAVRAGEDAGRPRAARRPRRPRRSTTASTCCSARTGRRWRCSAPCTVPRKPHAVPSPAADASPVRRAPSGRFELTAWNAPAPLHLAGGVLSARGLSWRERVALIAGFREPRRRAASHGADETVAQRLAATPPRAFAAVWEPLCLAALNTPPERASAQVFAHVLRSAFARHGARQRPPRPGGRSFRVLSRRRRAIRRRARRQRALRGRRARDRRGGSGASRSRRRRASRRSPPPSSPSARISWPRRSATRGLARPPGALRSRSVAALRVRIDHDDLPRLRRLAFRSRVPMLRLDDAPGNGRSTAAARWGATAPPGTHEPDRGRHQRERAA